MQKKLPKTITQEEFEKILGVTKKSKREDKKQLMVAMLLGFEAGMRISEVVGYHEKLSRCCKEGIVEVRKDKRLLKYCKKCEELLSVKDVVFGKEWAIQPLTKDQVESASIKILGGKGQKDRIVPRPKRMNEPSLKLLPLKVGRRTLQRYITKLGRKVLSKDITFHTLRHGFGSHLAQTMPLHQVQMLMGHSRLDTTGIYLHANPKQAVDGAREIF